MKFTSGNYEQIIFIFDYCVTNWGLLLVFDLKVIRRGKEIYSGMWRLIWDCLGFALFRHVIGPGNAPFFSTNHIENLT